MGELEEAYIKLCKIYGLRPVGHTWLWKTVGTLSMLGFLEKRLSGLGRKGKTTLIEVPIKSKKHLYKQLSSLIRRRTAEPPELELSQDTL